MATGQGRGEVRFDEIYNDNDAVDEKLLMLVANHIIYDVNNLRCIARDLGINGKNGKTLERSLSTHWIPVRMLQAGAARMLFCSTGM